MSEKFLKWFTVVGLVVIAGLMVWNEFKGHDTPVQYPYDQVYDNHLSGGSLPIAYSEGEFLDRHPILKMRIEALQRENSDLRNRLGLCTAFKNS